MPLQGSILSEGACYQNVQGKNLVLYSLLVSSHRLFSQVSFLPHLDNLLQLFPNESVKKLHDIMTQLDSPSLDSFRICTCFENYYKAKLIQFGYIVHKVNRSKSECLHNEQMERPVKISEIKEIEKNWQPKGDFVISILDNKTIGLRLLIDKDKYQEILQTGQNSIEGLNKLQKTRNSIHFLAQNLEIGVDIKYLVLLKELREIINTELIDLHTSVLQSVEIWRQQPHLQLSKI